MTANLFIIIISVVSLYLKQTYVYPNFFARLKMLVKVKQGRYTGMELHCEISYQSVANLIWETLIGC